MRKYNVLFFIFAICFCTIGQSAQVNEQDDSDTYSINTVKFLIKERNLGLESGFGSKSKHRLGDKISIALMKIFSENDFRDTQKVKLLLPLIQSCFDYPGLIEVPEDKKPKVTLVFLSYLESLATDSLMKREINETINIVKEKTSATKK